MSTWLRKHWPLILLLGLSAAKFLWSRRAPAGPARITRDGQVLPPAK